MIYTNLFKVNKAKRIKTTVYYMVESRRYKFNIIFDKKFTSVLSGMALGTFMIASINVGIYFITTSNNARILAELEAENSNYMNSLSQLESQKLVYEGQKANAENIYNISDKPTKWSSIIESIAEQLPYDTVLTSITTTNSDSFKEDGTSSNPSGTTDNTNSNNTNNTNTNANNTTTDNNSGTGATENPSTGDNSTGNNTGATTNTNNSSENNLSEQISSNENIVENNIITITGKSLSMVNLSLFLDKLDKLDIFSKVECSHAEKEGNSDYYSFIIYAFLN